MYVCVFSFRGNRWKAAALADGSGLDRQELERVNSLMDMRIKNLSEQLDKLDKSNNVRHPCTVCSREENRMDAWMDGVGYFVSCESVRFLSFFLEAVKPLTIRCTSCNTYKLSAR